jgi:deoxyadenosine/deoxycytidine kinase
MIVCVRLFILLCFLLQHSAEAFVHVFNNDRVSLCSWGNPVVPDSPPCRGLGLENPLLVSIEGNIGAGKSTLLDALRKSNPEWVFIDEPVGVWSAFQNENKENMLEVFYKDRSRWSYTFQNCALLTRFQNIESAIAEYAQRQDCENKRPVFITERCLDTDYQVFTKMLRAEGSIDKLEYDLYECWFSHLKSSSTQLSAIVHVNTPPEICAKRILKRGREGEQEIPLEYLQALDKYQRDWVLSGDVPCLQTSTEEIGDVISFVSKL